MARTAAPLEQLLQRSSAAIEQARLLRVSNKAVRAASSALCDEALAAELARQGVLEQPVPPVPTRGPDPDRS